MQPAPTSPLTILHSALSRHTEPLAHTRALTCWPGLLAQAHLARNLQPCLLQVDKEKEAECAALGSPAAAVPTPEEALPQQSHPSDSGDDDGNNSLVNLLDQKSEVRVTPSCALKYSN